MLSPYYDDPDLPIDGPIVVRLLWDLYEPLTLELSDASGLLVEHTVSEIGVPGMFSEQGKLVFIKPTSPLVEGESYEVRVYSTIYPPDELTLVADERFVAVAAPAGPPPAPPVVEGVSYVVESGDCLGGRYATFELGAIPERSLVLVDRDGAARLEPDGLSGSVSAFGAGIGTSYCNDNWRGAGYGASATARVATIDDSGRFSGWSEPVRLRFPEDPNAEGCACRLRPPGASESNVPLAALLALLVGARARVARRARR